MGADAEADEEAEASEEGACARADEASKLRVTAKATKKSRLQALGKPNRMRCLVPTALSRKSSDAQKGTPGALSITCQSGKLG
jgi:hypothetical protein